MFKLSFLLFSFVVLFLITCSNLHEQETKDLCTSFVPSLLFIY